MIGLDHQIKRQDNIQSAYKEIGGGGGKKALCSIKQFLATVDIL